MHSCGGESAYSTLSALTLFCFGFVPEQCTCAIIWPQLLLSLKRFTRRRQVGDASGVQSPLSFGGFGALMRHMPRVVDGVSQVGFSEPCLVLFEVFDPHPAQQVAFQPERIFRPALRRRRDAL
eukprot:6203109-Pleurochrysis_carterae.AAC.1